MAMKLKYIGDGRWLPGVPAADHEVNTREEADALVASGLYERVGGGKPTPAVSSAADAQSEEPS